MYHNINSNVLQESTMSYISVELAVIEIAGKYVPISYTQGMNNTIASPILCYGNHQTQSPIAAQGSKSLKINIKWEVHKRTRQEVFAKLESYIYVLYVVCANNN